MNNPAVCCKAIHFDCGFAIHFSYTEHYSDSKKHPLLSFCRNNRSRSNIEVDDGNNQFASSLVLFLDLISVYNDKIYHIIDRSPVA